jgi:hypothetical protein
MEANKKSNLAGQEKHKFCSFSREKIDELFFSF